jgi:hypothetical protein
MKFGGTIALALMGGCGGGTTALSPTDAGGSSYDATVGIPATDGASEGSFVRGPTPPTIACTAGGDAAACPVPPPACTNAQVAVLYSGGQCVAGTCTWSTENIDCQLVDASCVGAAGFDAGLDVPAIDGSASLNVYGCLLQVPPAPSPPPTTCDVDANPDSSVCPLPASVCTDSSWLVYYDDGQCVVGLCAWQARDHYCSGVCRSGACVDNEPTAPPPPYMSTAQ